MLKGTINFTKTFKCFINKKSNKIKQNKQNKLSLLFNCRIVASIAEITLTSAININMIFQAVNKTS